MKATLAMLACLSMVGLVTAATVDGNNTAVVIQKNAVRANGWQFICVPVNALDITGGTAGTVAIEDFLPPSLYTAGTEVSVVDSNGLATLVCTLNSNSTAWVKTTENSVTDFAPGTILWLQRDTTSTATVFCGQERTLSYTDKVSGKLVPMKNDSSKAIGLDEVLNPNDEAQKPAIGDRILVLKANSVNYTSYTYDASVEKPEDGPYWMNASGDAVTDKVIAAGEAFYYYSK